MNIKPMNDNTIIMNTNSIIIKKVNRRNKNSNLPPILNKIASREKIIKYFFTLMFLLLTIICSTQLVLMANKENPNWLVVTFYAIITSLFFGIFASSVIQLKNINGQIKQFENDFKGNDHYEPPFIAKIYKKSFVNQVRHNWITVNVVFYMVITILLIHFLKDTKWWIFDFKSWLKSLLGNPDIWFKILTIILVSYIVTYVIFSIIRKDNQSKIEIYLGEKIMTQSEIEVIKERVRKTWKRGTIILFIFLTIIGIISIIIIKRRRK